MVQPAPETSCDMTVASAAPATFMLHRSMNTKSSAILSSDDIIRNISGVRLSPSARIIADDTLYRNVVGMPANIITMYM